MKPGIKELHFRIPRGLYERFHRLFPGIGEKQRFFIRVVERAVAVGSTWSVIDQVMEEIEDEEEENDG